MCLAEPIRKKERIEMEKQTYKRCTQSYYAKVIGEYCYRAIERVKGGCEKKVNCLYEKYPYDEFEENMRKNRNASHTVTSWSAPSGSPPDRIAYSRSDP